MSRIVAKTLISRAGEGTSSPGLAQPGGAGEIDRDELRDAALGHGASEHR
jgi:hypothetical protein